jgi:hypothetical protein
MKKFIKYLKGVINEVMCSDDANDVIYYLDEYEKYKKGFNILMDYFEDFNDFDKPIIDKKLKRLGL